nr:hypothetical protein [uncultured Blautia sp.]
MKKQTEKEKLINDCNMYLQQHHYKEFVLLYVLSRDNLNDSPYQYSAVASTDENVLFFDVYAKESQPDIYRVEMCSADDDLFFELSSNNCTIAAMMMEGHFSVWEQLADIPREEITYLSGLETYLEYCRDNQITRNSIKEALHLDVPDIFELLEGEKNLLLHNIEAEQLQLQKVVDTILNGTDESDLILAQDMLNGIWDIDNEEPILMRTELQQAACDICILYRDYAPEFWHELRQSGDTEEDLVKAVYSRLKSAEGRELEASFLQKICEKEIPKADEKKLADLLAILRRFEKKQLPSEPIR